MADPLLHLLDRPRLNRPSLTSIHRRAHKLHRKHQSHHLLKKHRSHLHLLRVKFPVLPKDRVHLLPHRSRLLRSQSPLRRRCRSLPSQLLQSPRNLRHRLLVHRGLLLHLNHRSLRLPILRLRRQTVRGIMTRETFPGYGVLHSELEPRHLTSLRSWVHQRHLPMQFINHRHRLPSLSNLRHRLLGSLSRLHQSPHQRSLVLTHLHRPQLQKNHIFVHPLRSKSAHLLNQSALRRRH